MKGAEDAEFLILTETNIRVEIAVRIGHTGSPDWNMNFGADRNTPAHESAAFDDDAYDGRIVRSVEVGGSRPTGFE